MSFYGTNDYRNYLAHHGILGQKWGKRNGPPYPLNVTAHSTSEKKAGWRKSLYSGTTTEERPSLSEEKGYHRGLKLKKSSCSLKEDLQAVNPHGFTQNCMSCTLAFELRRRGYDVESRYMSRGVPAFYSLEAFKKAKLVDKKPFLTADLAAVQIMLLTKKGNQYLVKNIEKKMQKQGVGARGNLMMQLTMNSGHSVAYEVTENGFKIFDAQAGIAYSEDKSKEMLSRCIGAEYIRYDNIDIDDERVFNWVINREKR